MPVASERSFCGNHSATVLIAAGKLPDSPSPRKKRANPNSKHGAGQRVAHGGEAPDRHHQHVADARAQLVDKPAGGQQANRVGDLECVHNVAVADLRHADAVFERGLEDRDYLAIHVVD